MNSYIPGDEINTGHNMSINVNSVMNPVVAAEHDDTAPGYTKGKEHLVEI